MKLRHVSLIALVMGMTACNKKSAPQTTGIHLENLDTTVVAQNDFYQYACGGWMKSNPLTAEYARFGSFDKLALDNLEQVNGLIATIAQKQGKEAGSVEQKIGDLYNMAMDSARLNAEGATPLQPTLQRIAALNDKASLPALLSELMKNGEVSGFFYLYVDADAKNSSMNLLQTYQGGYALGEREYYLDTDAHTTDIRNKYLIHVGKMFELFGFTAAQAKQNAATVLRMETMLATAAYDNVSLRDPERNYNKMTLDELHTLVPQFDWKAFFNGFGITTSTMSVGQKEHLQAVGELIATESVANLATYLQWQAINVSAHYLSDSISAQNFDFYGKTMSGRQEQTPRWKRAVNTVNATLGEAVGQMYVATYFPPAAKKRMLELVHNLQTALGERIQKLEWMSEETKTKAMEKLNTFHVKVGYPDKWRDYTALQIRSEDSYYTNMIRAARFQNEYDFSFVDKPVDAEKWYMTPQTVNAYYNPSTNEICFPSGILQYPFFDLNADNAFNYGAIGVVIAHEMTHGFDDQGCQFDKDGNLNNWWSADDKASFDARTLVMVDYFDKIEVAPGVFANGKFTLGENIADHGGLQVAYQAFKTAMHKTPLKTVDGFTPEQRFFLAYANVWAGNIRHEEVLALTKSDPHSLGRWRVNGALPHIDAWYEAFNVTQESPMYVAPANRVSIW